jgi:hypothetical protein
MPLSGTSHGGVAKQAREKALGYLSKLLLGFRKGFKILPDNDAKML